MTTVQAILKLYLTAYWDLPGIQLSVPFGWLKARWSFLTKKVVLALESVRTVIYACFVLHNYCELNKCVIDAELVKIHIGKHRKEKENENYLPNPVLSGNLDEGEVVRYVLRCYIENSLNREWNNRTQTCLLNLSTISERQLSCLKWNNTKW